MSAKQHALLCWHSANHGLPVLENAIKALANRRIAVGHVCYLVQTAAKTSPQQVAGVPVETVELLIQDPTSHTEVYQALRERALPKLSADWQWHVNVSPGTPAMHAVWLVLHAGGAFPPETRLWSSQFDPKTKRTRIDEVEFGVTTYLAEIRRFARTQGEIAVYDVQAASPARKQALEQLRRYASVPGAPLLLLGERGVGKTRLVETFIATLKQRQPVVTVPCGGLDSALAESALFGHTKGAFTGAVSARAGFLKQAHGGILFLDEVQDLPQTAQRKLVRTLQDRRRRFRAVGCDEETTADFDLVCASNLDLPALRERLDADFFDRLSQLIVTVPPLRLCREDLQGDWRRVWQEMRADIATANEAPWNETLRNTLEGSPLPGNLRDLQRLALLLRAWEGNEAQALADWRSTETLKPASRDSFGAGTRRERVNWFCGRLAQWARAHFGNWQAAANALDCDEKTLRTDAAQLDDGVKLTRAKFSG